MPSIHLLSPLILLMLLAMPALAWAKPVTVAVVEEETLRPRIELIGTSVARQRSALSSKVEGLVARVAVDEGRELAAGDLVLELNRDLAELEHQAKAALEAEALARLRDAERVRDELLRLEKGSHASKAEIDSAVARVEIVRAELEGARAQRALAQEMLARHRLTAPFAGMVVERNVEVGEWVKTADPAVVLMALDTIRVEAPLPQRYYDQVRTGARVQLRFDALPGQAFQGEVVAKVAAGDARSRNFPLLIDLPNPDHRLAPGMSARLMLELEGGEESALTVPRDAVVLHSDGRREVWRVEADAEGAETVQPVRIETGRAMDERLAVAAGDLAAGDRIVLLGNENLKPGQTVTTQAPE